MGVEKDLLLQGGWFDVLAPELSVGEEEDLVQTELLHAGQSRLDSVEEFGGLEGEEGGLHSAVVRDVFTLGLDSVDAELGVGVAEGGVFVDDALGHALEAEVGAGINPGCEGSVPGPLNALVVEAVSELVSFDDSHGAVVDGVGKSRVEEGRIEDAGREGDGVELGLVPGVDDGRGSIEASAVGGSLERLEGEGLLEGDDLLTGDPEVVGGLDGEPGVPGIELVVVHDPVGEGVVLDEVVDLVDGLDLGGAVHPDEVGDHLAEGGEDVGGHLADVVAGRAGKLVEVEVDVEPTGGEGHGLEDHGGAQLLEGRESFHVLEALLELEVSITEARDHDEVALAIDGAPDDVVLEDATDTLGVHIVDAAELCVKFVEEGGLGDVESAGIAGRLEEGGEEDGPVDVGPARVGRGDGEGIVLREVLSLLGGRDNLRGDAEFQVDHVDNVIPDLVAVQFDTHSLADSDDGIGHVVEEAIAEIGGGGRVCVEDGGGGEGGLAEVEGVGGRMLPVCVDGRGDEGGDTKGVRESTGALPERQLVLAPGLVEHGKVSEGLDECDEVSGVGIGEVVVDAALEEPVGGHDGSWPWIGTVHGLLQGCPDGGEKGILEGAEGTDGGAVGRNWVPGLPLPAGEGVEVLAGIDGDVDGCEEHLGGLGPAGSDGIGGWRYLGGCNAAASVGDAVESRHAGTLGTSVVSARIVAGAHVGGHHAVAHGTLAGAGLHGDDETGGAPGSHVLVAASAGLGRIDGGTGEDLVRAAANEAGDAQLWVPGRGDGEGLGDAVGVAGAAVGRRGFADRRLGWPDTEETLPLTLQSVGALDAAARVAADVSLCPQCQQRQQSHRHQPHFVQLPKQPHLSAASVYTGRSCPPSPALITQPLLPPLPPSAMPLQLFTSASNPLTIRALSLPTARTSPSPHKSLFCVTCIRMPDLTRITI